MDIVILRPGKALAKRLVESLGRIAGFVGKPVRHRNHLAHAGIAQRRRHAQCIAIEGVELALITHVLRGLDQQCQVIAPVPGQHRLRAAGLDFHGIRNEVLHPPQRMQLVPDDLHIGTLHAQLLAGLAQHRLAKAVVLADQVDAFDRLVILEHIHQGRHAHVGVGIKTKMPVAALFVRQDGIDRRIVQEQHALARLALVVLVDGIDQRCRYGRRIALRNHRHAIIDGRTQRRQRFLVLPLVVIAFDRQVARTAGQLDATARIDALSGPDQVAKHRLTGVGEGPGEALNERDPHRRLSDRLRLDGQYSAQT